MSKCPKCKKPLLETNKLTCPSCGAILDPFLYDQWVQQQTLKTGRQSRT